MQVYKNDSTIGSNGTNTTVVFNGYVEKKFSNYRNNYELLLIKYSISVYIFNLSSTCIVTYWNQYSKQSRINGLITDSYD